MAPSAEKPWSFTNFNHMFLSQTATHSYT